MRDLSWYIKRARVMHSTEVLHRIKEYVVLTALRCEHGLGWAQLKKVPPRNEIRFCTDTSDQLPALTWNFRLTELETIHLLEGEWPALGFSWKWRPESGVWSAAPDTGETWPQDFFDVIPCQTGNPFGDVRVAWESSRLQQLVSLALLALEDVWREGKAVELLEAILDSWVRANPPLSGIHYVSAMECALRMIAVCHALDMVRTKLIRPEQTWANLLRLVMSHARLIERRLSLYSSAGNHTVAEGCGLVYAGTLFPEFSDAEQWKTVGMRLLEQEAARQVFSDGGGIEQALGYQVFIIDLLGLVQCLFEHRCEPVPEAISNAVRNGRTFLKAFGQNRQSIPSIGDQDGGHALSRHLQISWEEDSNRNAQHITFSESGYTILCGRAPSLLRLVLDHGSLGMAPCFAHGHADALSVILNWADHAVLIDPGTYTYTGNAIWRTYFRGTRAHNTVAVDDLDQAVPETAFMWTRPYLAQVVLNKESQDGAVTILVRHNGYESRVGVTHWRAVLFDPPNTWLIWDRLTGNGLHKLELNWHLGIEPSVRAGEYVFHCDQISLYFAVEGGASTLHRGDTAPISGWRSLQYGLKEPISTLRTVYTGSLPHEFTTHIHMGADVATAEPLFERLPDLRQFIDETTTR